ncbi:MAG: MerR family transcriptional regulator [Flavobacteriales bacterium]|nr:MerR family transcriptional regulator [Flavobacteriales bacterium]
MLESPFRSRFQIRDLEEFSGVKAHTIRIWEKRYGLLRPERTLTNIRTYGLEELKNLLNVAYLNRHGHKISRIAKLSQLDRERLVRDTAQEQNDLGDALTGLKMSMLGFDEAQFDSICDRYRQASGFRAVVEDLFVPLLEHIGLLWQTSSICPSHEHFVSNLVRQKISAEIDALPPIPTTSDPIVVLFLPEHEIHELGLLYVAYVLRSLGRRAIYLGQSVPMADLEQVSGTFSQRLIFISFVTAFPAMDELIPYANRFRELVPKERCALWLCGGQIARLGDAPWPEGVRAFTHIRELLQELEASATGGAER